MSVSIEEKNEELAFILIRCGMPILDLVNSHHHDYKINNSIDDWLLFPEFDQVHRSHCSLVHLT